MKQSYRIISTLFLSFFMVGIAYAQFENTRITDCAQYDNCTSYRDGLYFLDKGIKDYKANSVFTSEVNINLAISKFEQHLAEHPCHDSTAYYLGNAYYLLSLLNGTSNQTNSIDDYNQKAKYDTIARFKMHYFCGCHFFFSDTVQGIEPDYCKALTEFSKAIDCYSRDIIADTFLLDLYKSSLFSRASIFLRSYYSKKFERLFKNVGIPTWDTCVEGQQIERCIEDMNRIIDISLPDVDSLALGVLGQCYYEKKDCEKATEYCNKAGVTLSPPIDWLDETFIDSWRNDYNLYHYMYSDNLDGDVAIDGWENWAHLVMWYYLNHQSYEKALDFWFKIRNNFSFSYKLLYDQAWCRIQLGDFSAMSDLAFAYRMWRSNLIEKDPLPECNGDPIKTFDTIFQELGAEMIYYEKDYDLAKDYYGDLYDNHKASSNNILTLAICYRELAKQENNPNTRKVFDDLATQYFREVIETEKAIGISSSTPYAYLLLGEQDNAVKTMEQILCTNLFSAALTEKDSLTRYWIHYDAAKIYAKTGDLEQAKQHIKKAFEYYHEPLYLAFALKAPYFDPIQNYVEEEIERYKKELGISEPPIHRDTIVCDIPFRKREVGHTRTISCTISKTNDTLIDNMLFDPGADYVLITPEIATRIGITDNDVIGSQGFNLANGNYVKGNLVSLKEVRLGNIVLENVQAIVDKSNDALPLLGCTVWNNLKVEIPSPANKGMIRLTYIKESIDIPDKQATKADKPRYE